MRLRKLDVLSLGHVLLGHHVALGLDRRALTGELNVLSLGRASRPRSTGRGGELFGVERFLVKWKVLPEIPQGQTHTSVCVAHFCPIAQIVGHVERVPICARGEVG